MWSKRLLVGVVLCVLCGSTSARALTESEAEQRASQARDYVIAQYDSDGPGASFLIGYGDRILLSGAVGLADVEFGVENSEDTLFRLGSISKCITAVAVLQLVERGILALEEPIATYAPELPEQMGRVTLRQLLSHRSGLAEHAFKKELIEFIWFPMTTDKLIEIQANDPIEFEPGERYSYVNFNYVLVAHVVEKVTGKSFTRFADEDIFGANDMAGSAYDVHYNIISNRAEFYEEKEGVLKNAADLDMSHVSAAGALLSSTKDMFHWARLMITDKLVTPKMRAMAWTSQDLPDGTPTSYGLGFNVQEFEGARLIWHSGLTPGAQAAFGLAPEEEFFVVVLSNGFHLPNTTRLMRGMMSIMLTGETP